MMRWSWGGLSLLVVLAPDGPLWAQTRERDTVPEAFTWKLDDLYPSDDAWSTAREKVRAEFDQILKYQGHLAASSAQLRACLELNTRVKKELDRLESYASMRSDQDTRVAKYQGFKQVLRQAATDYAAKSSFIAPEVTALAPATLDAWIGQEPGLNIYAFPLRDIQRSKQHRLSTAEERVLAEAGLLASGPGTTYGLFANAELPFPELRLSDGATARLNQAGFARHRASANRDDRKAVFDGFFGTFDRFRQTFGSNLSAHVNSHLFYAHARRYESSLHSALDENAIPVEVYHALVQNVNRHLGTFHRYLRLKQRRLGLDQLAYHDVYAPVVKDVDLQYSYEQAMQLVLEAVQPLGPEYARDLKRAFDERWIDVYPTPGKRAGAYCNGGAYDVHPYMLLNYNGQYHDVSTLAHELGHALHSFYSNQTQPHPTADYATFVAEVASTLNEALLIEKMLATITDNPSRLSLLMSFLDGIKGTIFRQTQFAEFELAIHRKAEQGQPLTGDTLTQVYGEILRRYYGHAAGVCRVDDAYCVEWAYVPHFYYNFYVYQYATSFTASTCLAERIREGRPEAVRDVKRFLSAGGSEYPVQILKQAGVDMLGSEPFDRTMAVMNRVMDQIEAIPAP
jgi:oligoendopeptidase F